MVSRGLQYKMYACVPEIPPPPSRHAQRRSVVVKETQQQQQQNTPPPKRLKEIMGGWSLGEVG